MSAAVEIAVRPAGPDDAATIARLHVDSWRATYRGIVDDAYLDALDVRARSAVWDERLADPAPAMRTLVAETDGRVVGFATTGPSRDDDAAPRTAEVQAIYVTPDAWGTGAGRALMNAAIDVLGGAYDRVTLWVLQDNTSARRFYERAGFTADGATTTARIGDADLPEVRYARNLTPPSRGR